MNSVESFSTLIIATTVHITVATAYVAVNLGRLHQGFVQALPGGADRYFQQPALPIRIASLALYFAMVDIFEPLWRQLSRLT